jgi:agmatine deiminase
MPAEWEEHAATWIAWPHNEEDWPGRFEPIPWIYGEIVRKLSQVERVRILVGNEDLEESARVVLEKTGAEMSAVEFHRVATDRVWARDFAPLFLKSGVGGKVAV